MVTAQDQTRLALLYQKGLVLKAKEGTNFLGQTSASERMVSEALKLERLNLNTNYFAHSS